MKRSFRLSWSSKFLPFTTAYFQVNSLYVDTGKHKVLIDNGMGTYLGPSGGHLPDHLQNLGVAPEEIDTIIISHAHLDHVFGTLAPDGSQVFPNARYVIGEQEWTYWMKPDIKLGNLLPEELKQLIVEGAKRHLGGIKERVEFVKPGQEVVTRHYRRGSVRPHTRYARLQYFIGFREPPLFCGCPASFRPQRCASRVACWIR